MIIRPVNGGSFGNILSVAIEKNRQYLINSSTSAKQTTQQNTEMTKPTKSNIWMYLAGAGIVSAGIIYFVKRGHSCKRLIKPQNPTSSATNTENITNIGKNLQQETTKPVSEYLYLLANGLKTLTGENVDPKSLTAVMNKTEFIEAISKLTRENYIASKENIERGIFKADLHSHSIYSDGKGTIPNILNQVATYANKLFEQTGEKFIFALTDHDSVEGSKEALKIISKNPEKFKNVRFVVGSEVSYLIKSDKTTNPCETSELLVYGFNPFSAKVKEFFSDVLTRRLQARKDYINDLTNKFPNTKFSEKEFLEVFLGKNYTHNPMMNSYWQIYHYGQIKDVLSNTAKAKGLNPEEYFTQCLANAPQKLNLEEFKRHGIIENWITENPEIRKINAKYLPNIDQDGNIIKTSENLIEDIARAFKDEPDCTIGFAHPYYISERTSNVKTLIDGVKAKLGGLLRLTESYHQAYSPDLIKNEVGKIEEVSKLCENLDLIPIGGRDNHSPDFLKL